jgi:hypothetical protein
MDVLASPRAATQGDFQRSEGIAWHEQHDRQAQNEKQNQT